MSEESSNVVPMSRPTKRSQLKVYIDEFVEKARYLIPRGQGNRGEDRSSMPTPATRVSSSVYTMGKGLIERTNGDYESMSDVVADALSIGMPILYKSYFMNNGSYDSTDEFLIETFFKEHSLRQRMAYVERAKRYVEELESSYGMGIIDDMELLEGKALIVKGAPDKLTKNIVKRELNFQGDEDEYIGGLE